jgi:hypothetical protein
MDNMAVLRIDVVPTDRSGRTPRKRHGRLTAWRPRRNEWMTSIDKRKRVGEVSECQMLPTTSAQTYHRRGRHGFLSSSLIQGRSKHDGAMLIPMRRI